MDLMRKLTLATSGKSLGEAMSALNGLDGELYDNKAIIERMLESNKFGILAKTAIRRKLRLAEDRAVADVKTYARQVMEFQKHGNLQPKEVLDLLPSKLEVGVPSNLYELAQSYVKTDPLIALTMIGEGVRLNPYVDNNGAWTIGFGSNMAGDKKVVKSKLLRAGISDETANFILEGKGSIDMNQARRLFDLDRADATARAQAAFGAEGFKRQPKEVQAVLVDMAYNAGSPSKFPTVMKLFKEGKYDEAAKQLTLKYKTTDKKSGEVVWKENRRRVDLWRATLSGTLGAAIAEKAPKKKRK
jgi:GH24 family phage-related lysozyme (muramidase)